ncbi:MAG: hypothetical protein JWQ19_469 [Subtercola sp.]|nr:hypothetical protein [Subtercola sp.]
MADLGPLPGDPDIVLKDALAYQAAADAISQAANQLRALGTDSFHSQAVNALVSSAADAAGTITTAHARYNEAAEALLAYAGPMRETHDRAIALTAANRDFIDQVNTLRPQIDEYERQAQLAGPEQATAIAALQQLHGQWDALQADMSRAESEWHAALDEMHRAAGAAAARIHRGNEFGDLNDSFWDDLGDLFDIVKLVANIVSVVLKIVSVILTVLAVVFSMLAVVMPIFAVVAGLLFLYAQVVNLAIAILALLQFVLNGFHLLDLVLVAFAVVAAFGGSVLGNALGAAAKAGAAGAADVLGEAASKAAGELAKQAVSHAVEAVTHEVVEGILDFGSPDAQGLFDSISPVGNDFLSTSLKGGVDSLTSTFADLGQQVGSDFSAGVSASGLGGVIETVGGAARSAGATLGLGYDAAYGVANQVSDAVSQVGASLQQAANQGSQAALGSVLGGGADPFSSQLSNDLSAALGGPDVASKLTDAVHSQLGGLLGGLPGGDSIAQSVGDGFGGIAQNVYDAANKLHAPAGLAGVPPHG